MLSIRVDIIKAIKVYCTKRIINWKHKHMREREKEREKLWGNLQEWKNLLNILKNNIHKEI